MEEINIKDFFNYLKKYILIICGVVVIFVIGVFIYDKSIKKPLYTTYTTIILTKSNETQTSTTITQNDILLNQKLVETYTRIIKSKLVLDQVISETGITYTAEELGQNVAVEAYENTEMLKISVTDSDPELAASIANSIAQVFSGEVAKIYQMNNISVIDIAQVPEEVSNNTLTRDFFIALFISIFGSIGVIFIIYYFDDSIKLTDDLEEEIGMPVIAKVFKSDIGSKNRGKVELLVQKYPKSVVSESIKTLRTNLQFSSVDSELKTILVTSSIPGEGKSFISANLAISFTQTDKKVLIVDCDMRKPSMHKNFRVTNTYGIADILLQRKKVMDVAHMYNKNLSIITAGKVPPNPAEMLGSKAMSAFLQEMKEHFDYIILDTPPVQAVADAQILSPDAIEFKIIVVFGTCCFTCAIPSYISLENTAYGV